MGRHNFEWKRIEIKPEGWEDIQVLIKNVNVEETQWKPDVYWGNPHVWEILCDKFPIMMKKIFKTTKGVQSERETTVSQKKKKKHASSLKGEIQKKVEREIITKDLSSITFDMKRYKPQQIHFRLQVTFLLMLMVWNVLIYEKGENCAEHVTILDAMLSLSRYVEKYRDFLKTHVATLFSYSQIILLNMQERYAQEYMYDCLFTTPLLLVKNTFSRQRSELRLFPEQRDIIQRIERAILLDEPILIENQMPTGTGKSFLAVPLAQKIRNLNQGKTVLFACSNELVTLDIASNALLGDDLHLWLAKTVMDEKGLPYTLIRPYKRCFPEKWKDVYKKDDEDKFKSIESQWDYYTRETSRRVNTRKIPDIIVSDLGGCLALLRASNKIGNPFIAYIDEFISDTHSNRIVSEIGQVLPKQTVLLSAILPKREEIPSLHRLFQQRWNVSSAVFYRVHTKQVTISCTLVNPDGKVTMPHHFVRTISDLVQLSREIQENPRVRRSYSVKHVYEWSKSVQEILPETLHFSRKFPTLGHISHANMLDYAIDILHFWTSKSLDNETTFEELRVHFQKYQPQVMCPPRLETMFTGDSMYYEGKTLVVGKDIYSRVFAATKELMKGCPDWTDLSTQYERTLSESEKQKKKIENSKQKLSQLERSRELSDLLSQEPSGIEIPGRFIINHPDHFRRFHPENNDTIKTSNHMEYRSAVLLRKEMEDAFDPETKRLLCAGIGIYDKTLLSPYQCRMIMELYKHLAFLCSGKEIVFGTNLPHLVNIFIDGSFGDSENSNVLYQLMGRAGRFGKSYSAMVLTDSWETLSKLVDFHSPQEPDHEVSQMETFWSSLL